MVKTFDDLIGQRLHQSRLTLKIFNRILCDICRLSKKGKAIQKPTKQMNKPGALPEMTNF